MTMKRKKEIVIPISLERQAPVPQQPRLLLIFGTSNYLGNRIKNSFKNMVMKILKLRESISLAKVIPSKEEEFNLLRVILITSFSQ